MKDFLKIILCGFKTIFMSFVTVILVSAGILGLTDVSSYSGYKAIYWFIGSLLSIAVGILGLWYLGDRED